MMGLIRYSRPISNFSFPSGAWVSSNGNDDDAWDMINDLSTTHIVRGPGGGVDTDLVNDSDYISVSYYGGSPTTAYFNFAPICGDDDLLNLKFHIRRTQANATWGTTNTLVYRTGGVDYDVGLIQGGGPEYEITSMIDPSTNSAWSVSTLALGTVFGLKIIADDLFDSGVAIFTRVYIEATFAVGPTLGKDCREENWRYCDVCGLKHPYSRIQRPSPPHPQAGLAVCPRCYDQPDHDTIKAMSNSHPKDEQDTLY